MKRFVTSESVTEGHPDKICDFVADSILDKLLKEGPKSRSAVEVTAEPGAMHIMGEITSAARPGFAWEQINETAAYSLKTRMA